MARFAWLIRPVASAARPARLRSAVPRRRRLAREAHRARRLGSPVDTRARARRARARLRLRLVDPAGLVRGLRVSRAGSRDRPEARRGHRRHVVKGRCEATGARPAPLGRMSYLPWPWPWPWPGFSLSGLSGLSDLSDLLP